MPLSQQVNRPVLGEELQDFIGKLFGQNALELPFTCK